MSCKLLDDVISDLNAYALRKNGPGRELMDTCVKRLQVVRARLAQLESEDLRRETKH